MTRMKMAAGDRPKVKLECLRLLTTLRLNPAKSEVIAGFISSYLKLNAAENKQYERELEQLTSEGKDTTMTMWSEWGQEGMRQGLHQGKQELVSRQIQRRFGSVPAEVTERLDTLPSEQLDELGEALFDFSSLSDLETWLTSH